MMGKLLFITPLAALLLTVSIAITIQGHQQAVAQGDGCYKIPAEDVGEGWMKEICGTEEGAYMEQSAYISPSGERCYINQTATIDCGDEVNNSNRTQVE